MTETPEQVAERVVDENLDTHHYSASRRDLIAATLSALRNERERCAKVAEVIPDSKFDLDHEPARTEQQIRNDIARAIREGM